MPLKYCPACGYRLQKIIDRNTDAFDAIVDKEKNFG
jgi:hypothetical protein